VIFDFSHISKRMLALLYSPLRLRIWKHFTKLFSLILDLGFARQGIVARRLIILPQVITDH
jgi:hypothetical protein